MRRQFVSVDGVRLMVSNGCVFRKVSGKWSSGSVSSALRDAALAEAAAADARRQAWTPPDRNGGRAQLARWQRSVEQADGGPSYGLFGGVDQ